MKLYATLETSKGKTVSIADNYSIVVSLQLKNTVLCKLYMSHGYPYVVIDAIRGDDATRQTFQWRETPETGNKLCETCRTGHNGKKCNTGNCTCNLCNRHIAQPTA